MPINNAGYVIKSPVDAYLEVSETGEILGIITEDATSGSQIRFTTILVRTTAQITSPSAEDVARTSVLFQDDTTKGLYYSNGAGLVSISSGPGSGASLGAAVPLPSAATGSVGVSAAASHEDHVHPLPDVFDSTGPGLVPAAALTPSANKYLTETGTFAVVPTFGVNTSGLVPAASGTPDASKFLTETGVFATPTKSDVGLNNVDNTSDAQKNAAVAVLTNKTLNAPIINSPQGIEKIDVGLGNVDNTSDATKNAAVATLTNKTLVDPQISRIVNTGTLNLPISSDTLVGRSTTDTLINKTIDGTQNTITGISPSSITGVIPISKLATGTPTGDKFIRDDGTLQPIPGGGDAFQSQSLAQFATTSSAELNAVLSDATGIGQAVFSTMPTLISPIVGTQLPNDNSGKAASTAYVAAERITEATLRNKTIDGEENIFLNLPANRISGVIPIANLATGVPTGAKFIRDDGTLQALPGGGNALTASPLSQFASTTSAQLASIMTDETGTGSLVFSNAPTLVDPILGNASATSLALSTALPVTSGGTGANAIAPYSPIFGGTTSNNPFQTVSLGTAGFVLTSNGPGSLPTFQAAVGGGGSGGPITYAQIVPGTSATFASTLIDETGTGSVVFSTSPVLVTPNIGAATASSINKVSITQPTNGATLTISDGKTLAANNTLSLNGTDGSSVNFSSGGIVAYTSNTLAAFASTTSAQFASVLSDETGTGSVVFSNSPTLVTPNIGAATGTSLNLSTPMGVSSGGLGVAALAPYAPVFGGTTTGGPVQSVSLGSSGQVLTSNGPGMLPTFQTISVGGAGNALTTSPLSQFAATTSAQLASVLTDETGTGSVVFSNSPVLVTPTLGAALATSINKVTITAPATGATLSIADGKTLGTNNTVTFSGTDGSSVNFGSGGTVAYVTSHLGAFAATTSAQLASVINDETGSGSLVFSINPVLTTPNIGAATGSSLTLSTPLSVASGGLGASLLTPYAPLFGGLTGTGAVQSGGVGASGQVLTSNGPGALPTFQTVTGNAQTSAPLSQFASTTSAQLAAVISDETGSGSLVFSTSPALTGVPTAPTALAGTSTTQLATTAFVVAERTNSATLTNKTLTSPVITTPTITSPSGLVKGDVGLANVDNTSDATKNAAIATLTNKTISGLSNTLTNLPASAINGVIPIANLATGIPNGTKFIRDDGTLQVVNNGNAMTSNPLSQFATTTSAQLASVMFDETGTGSLVFANSPTLVSPNLGSATASSLTISTPLGVGSGGLGVSVLTPYAPIFGGISGTGSVQTTPVGSIGQVLMSNGAGALPTFQSLPGGGNALTSNPLSQFAATTSAQLASVISDETGTGALVFANSPTLVTPNIGAATGASLTLVSPLGVASGGIGLSTVTPYAPIFGGTTATGAFQTTPLGTAGQILVSNGPGALPTFQTVATGGGSASTSNPLSQFAATTSAQLAGVITDETGTGALVFATSPALAGTPTAPTAAAGTNTTQLATTAHVFAERSNAATLTNKTISGASNTLSVRIADLTDTSTFMKSFLAATSAANAVSILGAVASVSPGENITITGTTANPIINAGAGASIIEGGVPNSNYTGSTAIDGGIPSSTYAGSIPIDGGTP